PGAAIRIGPHQRRATVQDKRQQQKDGRDVARTPSPATVWPAADEYHPNHKHNKRQISHDRLSEDILKNSSRSREDKQQWIDSSRNEIRIAEIIVAHPTASSIRSTVSLAEPGNLGQIKPVANAKTYNLPEFPNCNDL